MGRSVFALSLMVLALSACAKPAAPEIRDVWTRDTIGSTAAAAVFMTISSASADRLIGASTPAAKKTDLMTMVGADGTMAMTYLEAIDIPAGKPVSLNASGLHVWLADLNQPLKAGQTISLTLKFEKAGEKQVSVSVIAPAAAPPGAGTGM